MTATVAQVRTLVPDKPQFDRAASIGDGGSTTFELPNSPVIASSVTVRVDGALQVQGVDYMVDLDLGVVEFTSSPALGAQVSITYQWALLSDDDITVMIGIEPDVRYAAAQALDTIAMSQALVLKVIRMLDLQTDGAKLADALRARAAGLRQQSDSIVTPDSFDIAEWALDPFNRREIIINDWLRETA